VPPVHELERLVVDGLDAVFERHVAFLSEPLEYFYLLLVNAVRPRAYGDADHAVIRERLPVHIFKLTGVAICVGVRLEIDYELLGLEPLPDIIHAVRQLVVHGIAGARVGRDEAVVVAVNAAPEGERPVPVRARESHVDRDLVDPAPESFFEVIVVRVIAPHHIFLPILYRVRRVKERDSK